MIRNVILLVGLLCLSEVDSRQSLRVRHSIYTNVRLSRDERDSRRIFGTADDRLQENFDKNPLQPRMDNEQSDLCTKKRITEGKIDLL